MELILLQKVRNLGDLGDRVKVRAGYGRNYLVPKGMGLPATAANISYFESKKVELQKASSERVDNAKGRADELRGRSFTIPMRAGEEGRLYGSVGPHEIADKITEEGIEVDAKEIALPGGDAIRTIGEHHVTVQLHPEIEVDVTIVVAQLTDMGVILPVTAQAAVSEEDMPASEQPEATASEESAAEPGQEEGEKAD